MASEGSGAHPVRADWRDLLDAERIGLIEQLYIFDLRLQQIYQELDWVVSRTREPETIRSHWLALLGEKGVGKTTVIQHWIEAIQLPHSRISEEDQKPYISISLSEATTSKALLARMLRMLGDPSWSRGTTVDMARRLSYLLKINATRLLIFDNIHYLFGSATERELYLNVDLIEQLTLPNEISVVFIGQLGMVETALHRNSPLHRTIEVVHFLRPYQWVRKHPATIREFQHLLQMIDQKLPLDPSNLDEEATAYSIYYATDGNPGRIFELICLAAKKAVRTRADALTRQLLAEAYDELITGKKREAQKEQVNPFSIPGFHEM